MQLTHVYIKISKQQTTAYLKVKCTSPGHRDPLLNYD